MFAIRTRTRASLPTKPTAQLAPTPFPAIVRWPVARPVSAFKRTATRPTAQPVLRLQTSPETAAHLAARRASVWLITFRFPTVLHVVLASPERLMSARHQAAKAESAWLLTSTSLTVRHVLTRHLNVVPPLVARLEAAFRITFLSLAVRDVRLASGRLTPTRSSRMPGRLIRIPSWERSLRFHLA